MYLAEKLWGGGGGGLVGSGPPSSTAKLRGTLGRMYIPIAGSPFSSFVLPHTYTKLVKISGCKFWHTFLWLKI